MVSDKVVKTYVDILECVPGLLVIGLVLGIVTPSASIWYTFGGLLLTIAFGRAYLQMKGLTTMVDEIMACVYTFFGILLLGFVSLK